MSRFHAAYSVGGLVGAGLGAAAAASGMSARANFSIAAVVVVIGGVGPAERFASQSAVRATRELHVRRPQWSWTLVALAAMAFGSFLAEGAANDWSAVYLHSAPGAPAGLAAVTYTVFSATMTAGRLVGDRLADRLGPVRLIRLSAGAAAVGFAVALIVGRVWAGLAGFAILGAGFSLIVPLVFTSASQLGRAAPNLAFVTSCGYTGMLVGPGLIGGLAEAVGLPQALGVIVTFSTLAAVLAGVTRPRTSVANGRASSADGRGRHRGLGCATGTVTRNATGARRSLSASGVGVRCRRLQDEVFVGLGVRHVLGDVFLFLLG